VERSVVFEVHGRPPVGGGSTARWEWRRALAERARRIRSEERLAAVSPTATFHVVVRFLLLPRRALGADLDNLVRPVLNTLFVSRDEQADRTLTGALFAADDARIYRLAVEKRVVEDAADEGVEVVARWDDDEPSDDDGTITPPGDSAEDRR
jgi:hypothetical protein